MPYGPSEAEKMDVFRAQGKSRGLLMYIHGGYWRSLDKKRFSFVAPALARAGITVAVPDYALCPAVQVEDIVMQVVQACAWLYRNGENFSAPANDAPLYPAGGGEENEGFHMQNRLMGDKWGKVRKTDVPCPGKNHFTVLDQVSDPESGLFKSILEMMDA